MGPGDSSGPGGLDSLVANWGLYEVPWSDPRVLD